jgi:plastocyanin
MHKLRSAVAIPALVGLLALTACGGQSGSGQHVTFDVKINGHTMKPNQLNAHQGDTIAITFTADKAEEIHLHGYDYKFEMKPGQPNSKTFTADKTGSFEIEIEDTSTQVGTLQVLPG